jgi:hypothetical protein
MSTFVDATAAHRDNAFANLGSFTAAFAYGRRLHGTYNSWGQVLACQQRTWSEHPLAGSEQRAPGIGSLGLEPPASDFSFLDFDFYLEKNRGPKQVFGATHDG